MSGISQGMGRKNAEMGKTHFSVQRMGKVRRLLKLFFLFFMQILLEDYKNVIFPLHVVKDICIQLARNIPKTLSAAIVEHFRGFF